MAYRYYNPNPFLKTTTDCTVRAFTLAFNKSWDEMYVALCAKGFELKEMPSSNNVWRAYMRSHGFTRYYIPDNFDCSYSVRQFCSDNRIGTFLLFVGEHVITVIDGDYYDTWDSGHECPTSFWRKER